MPDNVLDQVNFLVGADLGPYRAALKQAEAEAQASGARIKSAFSGAAGGGSSGGGPSPTSRALSELTREAPAATNAIGQVTRSVSGMHGATSTATREFRALFDEMSSGRTRMLPGTLAIIATRVFGLSLGTLAWAAAIAAIPIAFAVAAIQSENALSRIQRALMLTGNATGATAAQIRQMAQGISSNSIQSTRGAEAGLTILAGRGNVEAGQLPGAERAASGLAILTGQKLDKAAEELEKALAQPAEGAKTLNDEMKLLTGAQTREVQDLSAMGEKEKAQQIIIDALNARTRDATAALGGFAQALAGFMKGVQNFWANIGKPATPQEQLANVNTQLANWQRVVAGERNPQADTTAQATIRNLQQQQRALTPVVNSLNAQAATGEQVAKDSELVTQAMDHYRTKLDVSRLREEEKANAAHELGLAQGAAARELARATASHNAADIAAAQRNLRDVNDMAANAANPNYRWGSGVPKGRSARGPNIAAVGAASDETIDNAIKDELEAHLKLNQSLDARYVLQQAINQIEDRAKNAALAKELAEKRITGAAAKEATDAEKRAQQTRNEADLQAYQRDLRDEQGKIDDQMVGYQIDVLKAQEQMATVGSERLKIQLQLYDIETKQLRDKLNEQVLKDKNITPGRAFAMQAGLTGARSAGRIALAGEPGTAATTENQNLRETNQQLQLELGLKYADAELRAKELADLEAVRQLKQEGFAIDDAGYARALAQRKQLLEANAQLNLALQGQTKESQMLGSIREGLDNIALSGVGGFRDLKQAASDFLLTLARMALQLYIMQPLLNMMFGTSGSGVSSGSVLGSFFSAIGLGRFTGGGGIGAAGASADSLYSSFGGPMAAGGYTDPGKFYLVGEDGPELFRPGGSGAISPLRAPGAAQVVGGAGGAPQEINHNIAIQVSGNSDQQLMERVHLAASQAVSHGLKAYDQVQGRTNRARFIQQNRRALS